MKYNITPYELDVILIALDRLLDEVSKVSSLEKEEMEKINEIGNLRNKLYFAPKKQEKNDSNLHAGYLTVCGSNLNSLEKKMAEKMEAGWQPYGSLAVYHVDGHPIFIQPIVHPTVNVDPAAYEGN